MANVIYQTTATAWGGRDGHVQSTDGRLDLQLSVPKEMGGNGAAGTNPEQLFAAGYAACFHSALKMVARMQKADVSESAVSVSIAMVGNAASGLDLAATIEADLPGIDRERAHHLLQAAHQACPYSRATRDNIAVELVLVDSEAA